MPETDKVNILIVDDRPDKAMSLEVAIAPLNQNVVRVHSGREALRAMLKQDFAVILLDVKMPVMDGFETAALIRKRPKSEFTPIIFVSAVYDPENHVSRGYSLGAVDYILAPVEPEILRAKVSVFVDLFRMTAQIKRQAEERAQRIRAEAGRAEAEAARERSNFLAEASSVLGSSLEWEMTCAALARLAVPRLADCCVVDLIGEDESVSSVIVAHRDPEKEAQFRSYRSRHPLDISRNQGIAEVLRKGKTEICWEFNEEALCKLASDESQASELRELGVKRYAAIPLFARGRAIGILGLLSTSDRTLIPADISLAEELAQRAALALDNASLYKSAHAARREAEEANRAKDQFLAMLSHELRTPLTPVLSSISLLEAEEECPEFVRDSLAMIQRNVALEARLIDDLLDLTRISKGKLHLHLETVDAHPLLQNALEICRTEINEKKIAVTVSLEAEQHHVEADPARLQQVFWNLIKNAVKFTPVEGSISVSTSDKPPSGFQVKVTDTGIGIDPQLLPKIFDAFEQGRNLGKGGLGLGLAITKALTDLHKGTIVAASEGANRGSTFEVTLPSVDPVQAANFEQTKAELAALSHKSLRVLLVEDHPDTVQSLSRLLTKRGYEVRIATTLAAALESAARHPFDVLISDMGLPDGTGLDLMRRLSEKGKVRAVALSGFGMEDDIQRSREAGFSEHLTKPLDMIRLDGVLQKLGAA